jgi:hypothetical protein
VRYVIQPHRQPRMTASARRMALKALSQWIMDLGQVLDLSRHRKYLQPKRPKIARIEE